jgi:hypothetical protein
MVRSIAPRAAPPSSRPAHRLRAIEHHLEREQVGFAVATGSMIASSQWRLVWLQLSV